MTTSSKPRLKEDKLKYKAEEAVLGGCVRSPSTIPEVLMKVSPEDFEYANLGDAFAALVDAFNAGKATDEVAASNAVMESGALDNSDKVNDFGDAVRKAPLPITLPTHATHVRQNSIRRAIKSGQIRLNQAWEAGLPIEDLRAFAQEIVDASEDTSTSMARRIGETLDELLDEVSVRQDIDNSAIPTGFTELDKMLNGGLKGGQMVIVAARPGVGKSTIALDIMRNLSKAGMPSVMFSLEMSEQEVQERALSAESSVSIGHIKSGALREDEWERIHHGHHVLSDAPIFVDDDPELTMLEISARSKLLVRNHGVKLIVIDYLQLLRSGGKTENRQQEVSDFSRRIKLLAKSLNVPIIAVAQLNRGVESRGEGAKPKPSDLRESGSLEQDADLALLLDRPDLADQGHADAGTVTVIIGKNRGGPTGEVTLANQLHFSRFTNPQGA